MSSLFGRSPWRYLVSAAPGALAVAILASVRGYPPDARAFPAAIACVLLVLSGLDLAALSETPAGEAIRRLFNPTMKERMDREPASRQAAAALSLAALVAALVLLGIEISVPLYLFVSLRFRARRSWAASMAIAAGVSAVIWGLFVVALRLELYRGYLLSRLFPAG